MRKLSLLSTLFVIGFAANAWAGWVLEYASGDVTYLSSEKLKQVSKEDGTSSLLDSKSGKLSILRRDKQIYWQGMVEDYCAAIQQLIPQLEQKPAKPAISIKQAGVDTIAGVATEKYQVMAEGRLRKELWLVENPELTNESKALNRFAESFSACYPAQTIEEMVDRDPAYLKLEAQGYVMKDVTYLDSNIPIHSDEVVSLKQKDIPDSEFEVPVGFRRVESIMEIWQ